MNNYIKLPDEVGYWQKKLTDLLDVARVEHAMYEDIGLKYYGELSDDAKNKINWYTVLVNTDIEAMEFIEADWAEAQNNITAQQKNNSEFLINLYKEKLVRYIKVWMLWCKHIKYNIDIVGYDSQAFCGFEKNVLLIMTSERLNSYCKSELFLEATDVEVSKLKNQATYIEERNKKVVTKLKNYATDHIKTVGDRYSVDSQAYLLAHKFYISITTLHDDYFSQNAEDILKNINLNTNTTGEQKNAAVIKKQEERTQKVCLDIFNLGKNFIKTKHYYNDTAFNKVFTYLVEILKHLGHGIVIPAIGARINDQSIYEIESTEKTGFSQHLYIKEVLYVGLKNIISEQIIIKPIIIATDYNAGYKDFLL